MRRLVLSICIHYNDGMAREMSGHIRNSQSNGLLVSDIAGQIQNQILFSGTEQSNRWLVETSIVDPAKTQPAEIVGCGVFLNAGQQQMTGFPVIKYRNHHKGGFV